MGIIRKIQRQANRMNTNSVKNQLKIKNNKAIEYLNKLEENENRDYIIELIKQINNRL